jgi:bifunctional non-homologous end joining protein LigD
MRKKSSKEVKVDKRIIEVSNPDKIYFPEENISKWDVIAYYQKIAPYMLPYTKGRPISMQRYPDGITGKNFYHKEIPDYFPGWVKRVRVSYSEGSQEQVSVDNAETLVYIAEQACLTPHTWLSTKSALRKPDKLVIDFDPSPGSTLADVREGAKRARELFKKIGLASYVMSTGSRGYHVVVSLRPIWEFDKVKEFAKLFAEKLCSENSAFLTTAHLKRKRGKRVYIDIERNEYGQTSVPPFAVRARKGAPVATLLSWDELYRVKPDQFTIYTILKRVHKDPWKGFHTTKQTLSGAHAKLLELV